MSVNLSLFAGAGWQFFTDDGVPLSGGLLYTYAAGTTTPQTSYTSSTGLTANTNPIVLNSAGRVPSQVWLTTGSTYKFVLQTSAAVQIYSQDNISGADDFTAAYAVFAASSGSSLIGFIQSGAGAVAETVQTKLRETISVKDFGAVGNGSTDDTAAVQAAFTAANGATYSKTVFFPAGTYLINSTITCNPNTSNGVVPQILGEGSQSTIIKAGPSLGANAILKHQGASPSTNLKWTGFQLLGTGAANGQYGVYHINTCFLNYDDINFVDLQEGIRFENVGGGFTEQNVLSNCWAASCKYFLGFARQAGSTQDSFRGTGFSSECHMDLTTVANARLVRVYLLNSLAPNCYNMPIFASIWVDASSAVLQNDSATPIRASGYIRYESSATGWVMGTGAALTTDTFRGIMDGISYNPTPNTCDIIGIVNGVYFTDYGTFTPTLNSTGGAPTVTYAANGRQGFYEVVGVTVNFSIFISITSYTGGSGNLQISGLPFTSRTNTGSVEINRIPVSANKLTFTGVPFARVASNSTYVDIVQTTSGNDEAAITLASLAAASSSLFISGSYTYAAGN